MLSCAPFVIAGGLLASSGSPSIVLDGAFDDWDGVEPTVVDPADHPNAEIDFGAVRLAHDESYLHVHVELGREVSVQQLDGHVLLLLDADGSERSGWPSAGMEGVDIALRLTAPSQRPNPMGLALYVPTRQGEQKFSPYDADVAFAPTHASDAIELRIARGSSVGPSTRLMTARSVRGKLVAFDANGQLQDQTEVFTHALGRADPKPTFAAGDDPLARPDGTALRVVTWNVEYGTIFKSPPAFARCLAALDPDIILFEELTDEQDGPQLASHLDRIVPDEQGRTWNVVYGAGGGNLRCAVARDA